MSSEIGSHFRSYVDLGIQLRQKLTFDFETIIAQVAQQVARTLALGGKILFVGNGGSASDAQHLAAELTGRFVTNRHPLPGLALTTDTSALTAIANDFGFERVFERQINALGCSKDLLIAFSTSGNSTNVVCALEAAKKRKIRTVALTGENGGRCESIADTIIKVPSKQTSLIQEMHIAIGHFLCEHIDRVFTGSEHFIQTNQENGKCIPFTKLLAIRDFWRSASVRVVWTNGCFDLIHAGHLSSLQFAKKAGDILVVGVNSDESVRKLKGTSRPIVHEINRVKMLESLECVDYVTIMEDLTPLRILGEFKPDIHCKGASYENADETILPERKLIESYGGTIIFAPHESGQSTSNLVAKIKS